MPTTVTSQRRLGLHGKVVVDPGTTPIYDGADCTGWKIGFKADVKDVSANGDRARVITPGRTSASGSFEKYVASQLCGTLKVGDVRTVELYGGSDPDTPDTAQTGETFAGTIVITGFDYDSKGDNPEQENVTFEFSGPVTITAV